MKEYYGKQLEVDKAKCELAMLGFKAFIAEASNSLKYATVEQAIEIVAEINTCCKTMSEIKNGLKYTQEKYDEACEEERRKEAAKETLYGGENNG